MCIFKLKCGKVTRIVICEQISIHSKFISKIMILENDYKLLRSFVALIIKRYQINENRNHKVFHVA